MYCFHRRVWGRQIDPSPALSPRRLVTGFIVAGVIGLLVAATLEYWLVYGPGVRGDLKVGFIEEFVKGVAIVALAWGLRSFATRDGMMLGAAVGFGFASGTAGSTTIASPRNTNCWASDMSWPIGKRRAPMAIWRSGSPSRRPMLPN